ncbi:MAG: bifunctional 2-polyprenyl-6-hydroxyphenol methylase/3-demethylubiquinol 3-O-methyltransferase UbiG [Deltaproteobacteria bacterium]|nr:bifunctional 2-polyprenyl-6-hydroxyphenol methylase/3-demethylubiquinol 3-O-methyltransferase UbiG [Deltaproteobacteria bacterium]
MTTETEKFEKYGAEWWNPTGRLFSLHRINPLRFDYFSSKAGELAGKKTLDVGCGGGLLAERFAASGALVTGIDLSPIAIEAARKHAKESSLDIEYTVSSVEKLRQTRSVAFDIVICAEVLEHVDDLGGFLKDSLSMLKPDGLFFFGTINKTLKARLLAVFVAEDVLNMVPKGTHDYKRFVRPSALKKILEDNDVEMMELKGMSYDPLRFEFKLSNDTSVNYLGWARKRTERP